MSFGRGNCRRVGAVRELITAAFARLDRLAGGRGANLRVPDTSRDHERTRRAFRWILGILIAETGLSLGILVVAVVLVSHGEPVPLAVFVRGVAVFGITVSLFYFTIRAMQGWYWAYWRLRLFSQIFPVIALVVAAIPGLYPIWMTSEQIVFALLLMGVGDFLKSDHMRAAFAKDAAVAAF